MSRKRLAAVSDSAVMAAVIEIGKSEEDALASCLVVFSVQTEKKRKSETIAHAVTGRHDASSI